MASSIRVRMYRCGFGDAFLLSFEDDGDVRHVLVDFGEHPTGKIGTMGDIMADIEQETGGRLLLAVASHPHMDHISGFDQFVERFKQFQIEQVWLPWTDNIADPDVTALEQRQLALVSRLMVHLERATAARKKSPLYAAAVQAINNAAGDNVKRARAVMRGGLGDASRVRYLRADPTPLSIGGFNGLTMEILSPPESKEFFGRENPPANQRFLTAPGDDSTTVRPFRRLELGTDDPDWPELRKEHQPELSPGDLKRLHAAAEAPVERLALALDSARNNTSLVILFRFRGRSLLFTGDAQWGNWQSWIGTSRANQILSELDFLKVGHHGSENATPVSVVNALRSSGLAVMVSTQGSPFSTIPRGPLLTELEKHAAANVVVRSDWVDVPNKIKGPQPVPQLPAGATIGRLWIDYVL